MATPDPQQARRHHDTQVAVATAAGAAISRQLVTTRSWAAVLNALATYQLAAATKAIEAMAEVTGTAPRAIPKAFAGISSAGFPISEPIIAALDYIDPAPVEVLPAPWWDKSIDAEIAAAAARIFEGIVKDTGRAAFQGELVASEDHERYIRVLVPPSCQRCVVLAGRIYHQREPFDRHPPTCDCQNWPADSWEEARKAGLVLSPREAFDEGHIRDLTQAQRDAIDAGADINKVINANSGMQTSTTELFGHKVRITRYGTTKRSQWRKQNPSRLVRLTPESIYRIAESDQDAVRLLRLYGYIT